MGWNLWNLRSTNKSARLFSAVGYRTNHTIWERSQCEWRFYTQRGSGYSVVNPFWQHPISSQSQLNTLPAPRQNIPADRMKMKYAHLVPLFTPGNGHSQRFAAIDRQWQVCFSLCPVYIPVNEQQRNQSGAPSHGIWQRGNHWPRIQGDGENDPRWNIGVQARYYRTSTVSCRAPSEWQGLQPDFAPCRTKKMMQTWADCLDELKSTRGNKIPLWSSAALKLLTKLPTKNPISLPVNPVKEHHSTKLITNVVRLLSWIRISNSPKVVAISLIQRFA